MAEGGQPPDMGDLLAYFEERSRSLDAEGQPFLDASTLQFISLIRFDGVPILPPVLSATRRQEMQTYKREAQRRQNLSRAKKREELHAKVQSIVAGVEEKRAARQAAKTVSSKPGKKQCSKMESVSRINTKSTLTESGMKAPPEIIINVAASQLESEAKSSGSSLKSSVSAAPLSPKTSRRAIPASSSSTKSPAKSSEKSGFLSKQKSFSTQHLDRTPSRMSKDSSDSPGSAKNLSPNSGGLLPHPPHGRPQRRTSPLRQSASTPDLRTIDFSVETDHLTKPLYTRDLSVRGGRPQSSDRDAESSDSKKDTKQQQKKTDAKVQQKSTKRKEDIAKKDASLMKEKNSKKSEVAKHRLSDNIAEAKASPSRSSKSKPSLQKINIQNPLEALEREISQEEEVERSRKFERSKAKTAEPEVRAEVDPIQTAAAELFPFPISEEQALATLDSLQSDFASIEQFDSLPGDYNGIPLTSMKQKQIIHMLTKLSKALNIEDTLTSTTSSNASGDYVKDYRQDQARVQSSKPNVSVPNGASRRAVSANETVETLEGTEDDSVHVTNDSNTSAQSSSIQNSSASSYHSRARMSPTGSSSILSSASSVSGSRSRMSPKSFKNTTVHFSSVVTEISTSASQSYEDKISYRKMNITPKSSENFEVEGDGESPEAVQSSGAGLEPPNSLLSKVVLSPSIDSSAGSPGEIRNNPFETSSQDGELNTSDKENEFAPPESRPDENYRADISGRPSNRNQQVLNVYRANIPEGPVGPNHPAVIKSSQKPGISESSSLKLDHVKVLPQENSYGKNNSGIARFIEENRGTNSSTSSFQEEITRSYLHQNPEKNKLLQFDENEQDILRRNAETLEKQLYDMQKANILLTPVFEPNMPQSFEQNRSMLEEEEQIRSNLDRIHLEDDSEEDEKESEVEETQAPVSDEGNTGESDKEEVDVVDVGGDNSGDVEKKDEAVPHIPEVVQHGEVEEEEEGKAEHIQKYLNHVHEQSMQIEDNHQDEEDSPSVKPDANVLGSINDVLQSFTSTIQSMKDLSQDELFRIQAEQFEELQKRLIEQQRAQLEELFVAQRREQMGLQNEIENYHKKLQVNDSIDTIPLKNSIKPQPSASVPQVTQAWHYQNANVAMTPPFPVQPVASTKQFYNQLNTSAASFNTSYGTMPYPNPATRDIQGHPAQYKESVAQQCQYLRYPAAYGGSGMVGFQPTYGNPAMTMPGFVAAIQDPDLSHISHNTSYSTIPHHEPVVNQQQPNVSIVEQKPNTSQHSNPFIYPSSPSLYNPRDRDNASDVSGFAKATPKQLIFSNQSTPVAVSKTFKPVVHSPVKQVSRQKNSGKVFTPTEISDPAVQKKFDRVSASVKGYLTRRLLKTKKVQEIIKTIGDTRTFAFSFQAETPIKNGTFSREDRSLLERIVAQLQAALLDIHEIFFIIPVAERMNIIAASRQTEEYSRMRESQRSSRDSVSRSQPKISKATIKAMERKRQSQIAEESVFGSVEFRPKSAPPKTSSPHVSTDLRALRPLQGHVSPIHSDNHITVREVKERPKTARDKSKTGGPANKSKKTSSGGRSARTSAATTAKQQKAVPDKPKKTEKAWR